VPAGDPVALATALAEALNLGATARDALSLRARAHVRRNFSLEKMCAETLDVYERLLAAPRA
jgi:glycosyltransferase involved in cell wall biosynthesis